MSQFFTARFDLFLDAAGVGAARDKKERRVLMATGGTARKIMRRGMRHRKKKSQPGGYPNAYPGGDIRDGIFFNYDKESGGVLVGPTKYAGQPGWLPSNSATVPELLQQGGRASVQRNGKIENQVYRPRPFVTLTLQPAADALRKTMAKIELKK